MEEVMDSLRGGRFVQAIASARQENRIISTKEWLAGSSRLGEATFCAAITDLIDNAEELGLTPEEQSQLTTSMMLGPHCNALFLQKGQLALKLIQKVATVAANVSRETLS